MPCPRSIYGIAKDCDTSKGGIAKVYLSPYQDGAVKYSPSDYTVTGFSEYISFSEFYQRKGAASFSTTANIDLDNDLKFFKTTINLSFPKMSGEKSFYLDRLLLNPMIALIEDNNGNNWIFGIDNPVYTEQYSMQTGSNPKDANKYTVVLTCESDYEPKSVGHSIVIPTDKPITNIIYRLISDWGEQIIPSTGGTRTAHFTGVTTYVYEDGTTKVNEITWNEIYTFNPNQTAQEQSFDKQQTFYDQLDKFTYIQLPSESGKQLIGTYYEINPSTTSATVAAEATSYTFNWSGITVSAWSDGTFTSAVTYTERKTVTFSENTSTTQDKYYTGNYTYNGVNGTYNITQLKKGGQPEPPTPSGYTKDVLVGDRCYNELPEGTEIVDEKIVTATTFAIIPSNVSDTVDWNQTSYTFNWSGVTIEHYNDGSTTSSVTYTKQETITFSENPSTTETKPNRGTYEYNGVVGNYEIIQRAKPEQPTYTKREYVDDRCYSELPSNTTINDTPQPTPTPTVTATTYDVNPSSKSATVEWDATSYSIQYSGITIEHYSDGTSTSSVTSESKLVTFSENTSKVDVYHNGTYEYNGISGTYNITQLKYNEEPEPLPIPTPTNDKLSYYYFSDGRVESHNLIRPESTDAVSGNTDIVKIVYGTSVIGLLSNTIRSWQVLTEIVDFSKVTEYASNIIRSCPNLISVTIGSMDTVSSSFITSCPKLQQVAIYAENPPTAKYDGVRNPINNCPNLSAIYVPSNSVDAYKSSPIWSVYADIIKPMN